MQPDHGSPWRYQSNKAAGEVPELTMDKMRPYLDTLQSEGFINYSIDTSSYKIVADPDYAGSVVNMNIEVLRAYYVIAEEVMQYTV